MQHDDEKLNGLPGQSMNFNKHDYFYRWNNLEPKQQDTIYMSKQAEAIKISLPICFHLFMNLHNDQKNLLKYLLMHSEFIKEAMVLGFLKEPVRSVLWEIFYGYSVLYVNL